MAKVYIFLADGFEEVEALTQVDLLRRAGIIVDTVSITGQNIVHGAHGIDVIADILFKDDLFDADMLVLPGGGPGTKMLMQHSGLCDLIIHYNTEKKYLAAICAAPSVFGVNHLLVGKQAICYPGFEKELIDAIIVNQPVVEDDNFITSKAAGTSFDFGLALITRLCGKEAANQIRQGLHYER